MYEHWSPQQALFGASGTHAAVSALSDTGDGGRHVEKPHSGENRFLQSLEPADLAALQRHLKPVELCRGDVLVEARSAIENVYFPLSGMISLLAVMQNGEAIETAIVGREGVVGGSVANGNGHSFGQAMVQISGKGLKIARKPFAEACQKRAKLRALANRFQELIMTQAQQSAACHALHSVEARLCRWLLQSRDVTKSDVIELTQEFLSHMLGVQRTSVSLSAHALQDAGLIEYARGRITIRDRAGIEACACECYAVIRSETDKAIPPIVRTK
jgi:CRP-like cAMP-binding protein